jgi:1,4-dihydroxy-2-naphthoate octaprenyltransferase
MFLTSPSDDIYIVIVYIFTIVNICHFFNYIELLILLSILCRTKETQMKMQGPNRREIKINCSRR